MPSAKPRPLSPFVLAGLSALSLSGCAMSGDAPEPTPPPAVDQASDCPVIASRNWSAWIDAMPGPGPSPDSGGLRLNIAGEIDLPSPGYTVEWREGPADRAQPPGLRMRLVITKPSGMVTQVVTPTPVKYSGKSFAPAYRMIIVGCGDKALATITDIPTVH
jgi:hypothetical protein